MPLLGAGIITPCLSVPRWGIHLASTYSWSSGAAAELQGNQLKEGRGFAEVGCAGDMGVNWECWGGGEGGDEQKIRTGNKT